MNRTALTMAATMAVGAGTAVAGTDFQDYARVQNVSPQYERINVPRQECYSEAVPQAGEGNGRVASAAVGAVAGAIVGDQLQNRGSQVEYGEREVRRCPTVDQWESRITGYHVVYEYQGRSHTTFLPYDPGARLPVRVSVEPLGR